MTRKISICLHLFQKRHGDFRALEIAKEIGADGIDFSFLKEDCRNPKSIYSKSDAEIVEYYSDLYAKARELGIEVSQTHGRLSICGKTAEETEAAMRNARLDCMAAHCLHSPYVVFHGVNLLFDGTESAAEKIRRDNEMLFCRILDFAREFHVIAAMETDDQESLFGALEEFVDSFTSISKIGDNGAHFAVCVDTGHTHKAVGYCGNPSLGDTIRRLGNSIACLHLHDNDGFADSHRIPTAGSIDWTDVLNALDEIGYTGWYNLEPNPAQFNGFGTGFEVEYAAFAVKILRFMLFRRYGDGSCNYSEMDNSWLSYAKFCDNMN